MATLTVAWPQRNRGVPYAANSLVVTLSVAGKPVAQATVARPAGIQPTSKTTLQNLPFATLNYTIAAFPTAVGSGVAQATGVGTVKVSQGTPGTISVSLASTVSSVTISQDDATIGLGASTNAQATARDASGNIVLLAALGGIEPLTWSSDSPGIAAVSGTGPTVNVQGVAEGSTTLRATLPKDDAGGTVVGSAPVTVASTSGVVTVK